MKHCLILVCLLLGGCSTKAPTTRSDLKAKGFRVYDLPRQQEAAMREASRLQEQIIEGRYASEGSHLTFAVKRTKTGTEVIFLATLRDEQ